MFNYVHTESNLQEQGTNYILKGWSSMITFIVKDVYNGCMWGFKILVTKDYDLISIIPFTTDYKQAIMNYVRELNLMEYQIRCDN